MSGQTNWNPYGGGFAMDSLADSGTIGSHWVDFGSKAIYYLSDSDRDDVLAVGVFAQARSTPTYPYRSPLLNLLFSPLFFCGAYHSAMRLSTLRARGRSPIIRFGVHV